MPWLAPWHPDRLSTPVTLFFGVKHGTLAELWSPANAAVLVFEAALLGLAAALARVRRPLRLPALCEETSPD